MVIIYELVKCLRKARSPENSEYFSELKPISTFAFIINIDIL